ncbi:MAG: hypothetical protein HXY18_04975 [Bryobacteraceae bacterium]|nr:hypothetical protein [Bryobacteraceae bacterium]
MQKTIYSLPALRELLEAANRRYLEFLSTIEDPRNGRGKLDKLSQTVRQEGRSYPGFNLFDGGDEALFRVKDVIATGLKLKELVVTPQLAFGHLA